MFERIKTWIITKLRMMEYKKAHRFAKATRWFLELFVPKPADGTPMPDHYLHLERLTEYRKTLEKMVLRKDTTPIDVAFGDSLIDLIREYLKAVKNEHNFAIAGSIHKHMLQMIKDLEYLLHLLNVRSVLIGTLGGNSFLAGSSLEETTARSLEVLNYLRSVFPKARIIVYGLPPVYNIHATLNSFFFEQAMYQWVLTDFNAVFMPLQKKFDKSNNPLLPQPALMTSADGVHLTPYGATLFNELVEKARYALPGSIAD